MPSTGALKVYGNYVLLLWKICMTVQELFRAAQELSFADQLQLASQLMQSAIQKMQLTVADENPKSVNDDPIVGLYSGTPDLATRSKEILTEEIDTASGFSWKA